MFDPEVYLVGASGGVYALLAAHLANVMLNYRNMQYGIIRLLAIFLFGEYLLQISINAKSTSSSVKRNPPTRSYF